jgi:hypothetical protein
VTRNTGDLTDGVSHKLEIIWRFVDRDFHKVAKSKEELLYGYSRDYEHLSAPVSGLAESFIDHFSAPVGFI